MNIPDKIHELLKTKFTSEEIKQNLKIQYDFDEGDICNRYTLSVKTKYIELRHYQQGNYLYVNYIEEYNVYDFKEN